MWYFINYVGNRFAESGNSFPIVEYFLTFLTGLNVITTDTMHFALLVFSHHFPKSMQIFKKLSQVSPDLQRFSSFCGANSHHDKLLLPAWWYWVWFVVVQPLSHVQLFATPWTAACQAPLPTISQSLLKFMSFELVMLSNPLVLCCPLLLLPSIFPRIRVFFQWISSSHQVAKASELQFQC